MSFTGPENGPWQGEFVAKFADVPTKVDFAAMERETLATWHREHIVDKYLTRNRASDRRYSFIDGPITANNPMGVHHAWGRTYKDVFQRYKALRGFHQRYQNGFDCQGLWIEVGVEKELGLNSKREIEEFGLAGAENVEIALGVSGTGGGFTRRRTSIRASTASSRSSQTSTWLRIARRPCDTARSQ